MHGGWAGAFTWGAIPDLLRDTGHRLLAPDLPGLGKRRSELHRGITLSDHVDREPTHCAGAGLADFRRLAGGLADPLLTLTEAVRFTGDADPVFRFADTVRDDPAWEYHKAPCGHDVMGEATDQVVDLLLGFAA